MQDIRIKQSNNYIPFLNSRNITAKRKDIYRNITAKRKDIYRNIKYTLCFKLGLHVRFFPSRRQRNGSNFIALLARVIKMRVFHVLRGNAIVTNLFGNVAEKLNQFNFRQRLQKISYYT